MNKVNRYYPALIILAFSLFLFSCNDQSIELYGSWESILIENRSPLFTRTLPSSTKGEIVLELNDKEEFSWINKKENLNFSGKYKSAGNKIYLNIQGEDNPLTVEFRFKNNNLIIITEDGFSFTFARTK